MNRSDCPLPTPLNGASCFELLCDTEGTVVLGWVTPAVLYTRFEGGLTAQTGHVYAERLVELVAQAHRISFFCDSSRLRQYDLLARNAFIRVVRTNRRKFSSITMLTWAEGLSLAAKALVDTLGEPIELLTDGDAFDARLRQWLR